jgi:hypothetical protein
VGFDGEGAAEVVRRDAAAVWIGTEVVEAGLQIQPMRFWIRLLREDRVTIACRSTATSPATACQNA